MIQYIVNTEKKVIELLSGGTFEELKDLYNLYKGYYFTISPKKENKQGITVGAGYVPIIGNIEHI